MRVSAAARKHGVRDEDIRATVQDPLLVIALDDEAPQRQMVLGFDTGARLLEVVVLVFADDREAIAIHAMAARKQYRDLLQARS